MSSGWSSVDLGDGVAAYAPRNEMQEQFMPAFMAAGGPVEMAMFSRYDLRANVVTVYFSPAAGLFGQRFGAIPCDKPNTKDLGLSVGDQRGWDVLFPEGRTPRY